MGLANQLASLLDFEKHSEGNSPLVVDCPVDSGLQQSFGTPESQKKPVSGESCLLVMAAVKRRVEVPQRSGFPIVSSFQLGCGCLLALLSHFIHDTSIFQNSGVHSIPICGFKHFFFSFFSLKAQED